MKIRNDFVTNSSSSSFVVAFKSEDDMYNAVNNELYLYSDEVKDRLISDINRSASYGGWSDVDNEIEYNYSYPYNPYAAESLKKQIESDSEGKDYIAVVNYSDDDELESLLQYTILPTFSGTIKRFSHH